MLKYLSLSLLLAAFAAKADLLLTVNISDLSAVTFTATGNPALVNDSTVTSTNDGITLAGFFTTAVSGSGYATSSTLTASGTTMAFGSAIADNLSTAGGDKLDINFFYENGTGIYESQSFTTGTAALTGQLVIGLEGLPLVAPYTTGNIYAGYSGNQGAIIGTYTVIPEPSTTGLLLGAGGLAVVALRRFRRS